MQSRRSAKQSAAQHGGTAEVQHFLRMVNEPIPEGVVTTGLQEAPQVRCEIDHVYGFSGERRSCLYFGRDNEEIVYMAAAIGVVQDLKTRQQRLFGGAQKGKTMKKYERDWPVHQDDITDVHAVRSKGKDCLVVSGECGAKSTVHIWDAAAMKGTASFSLGGAARGINSLSMSPCQRYVACVDCSNDHLMTIYNVSRKKLIV